MSTRKYPRTLQEAFGPYTSHDVQEPAPAYRAYGRHLVKWLVISAALALVGGFVAGVLYA